MEATTSKEPEELVKEIEPNLPTPVLKKKRKKSRKIPKAKGLKL